ncbi:MAG: response regulator [Proteobacteria bacterium]|nr:response regulator [Pseudomonadota bacterium]
MTKPDSAIDGQVWKILTIDSIPSSNEIIELLSKNLSFQNRNLLVFKSSSLEDSKNILKQHSDIALILVDIMIEGKDSGLEFIEFVRNKLKNRESRIVLRTGYPECLPEKQVIQNHEIDGYIPKAIKSQLQIEVVMITAIRSYHQIVSTKEALQSLAGSIAHEIRNPLNSINLAHTQIKELLSDSNHDAKQELKGKLTELSSLVTDSIDQANHIINIILSDLKDKPVDPSDFVCLSVNQILPEIVQKFGYKEESEKQKVKLDLNPENNFIFKAIKDRFTFIIYNLLKNALYYLKEYPNSIVTVGTEQKVIEGIEYNSIYVFDTGPGIPPHIISKLFGDFFTSGKKEGTGLGLAFCKRNMLIFGGDVICESELGQGKAGWTKFSLLFPKLNEAETKQAEIKKRKILIVEDEKNDLSNVKSAIEESLLGISCDTALSNKEAIRMVDEKNKYDLILMNVKTPELTSIEATKEIRTINKDIPIITYSSNRKVLCRTISKWITDYKDDFFYLGIKEDYLRTLKDKKILLADDQDLTRIITKRILEAKGIKVTEVKDGKELLQLYKGSLDENGISEFSLIVVDIIMPPHNGDEAAKEIRILEKKNNIKNQNLIPIIALSGNGDKKDIHHYFDCGITDYFIKGSNPELLINIIASHLS